MPPERVKFEVSPECFTGANAEQLRDVEAMLKPFFDDNEYHFDEIIVTLVEVDLKANTFKLAFRVPNAQRLFVWWNEQTPPMVFAMWFASDLFRHGDRKMIARLILFTLRGYALRMLDPPRPTPPIASVPS